MRTRHLIVFLAGLLLLAACEQNSTTLRFVTPASPLDRAIAEDLTALLDRESSIRLEATGTPLAGDAALDALMAGDADIALVSNYLPYRDGISMVMPAYPTVLHIGYQDGRDASDRRVLLQGATIYAGPEGSSSRLLFAKIAERHKLTEDDYTFINNPDERPDVVVVFAPLAPERLQKYPDIRLFSMGSTRDLGHGSLVDAAVLLNPQLRPFIIPMGTYGDATPEAVLTVAADKIFVARRDLDQSVVYDLINNLVRLRPAISAQRPGLLQNISEDFDASRSTFVLHPGTQAFLQRSAPTIYERYSGLAEVLVTILIGLVSAVFGGARFLKMRRKNRIDTFYSKVLNLRNSVDDSATESERSAAADEIRELQNTAFQWLVDERLSADESFRIFITLSNDAIQQFEPALVSRNPSDN